MAIKKSQLYSSIWQACDALRGGMDASQYKDYVLVLLFVRYVSDKYAGKKDELVVVPDGGSFADLVKLKGKPNIGEGINKVLSALAEANGLKGVIDAVNFNDEDKLGKGKDMQGTLSDLIAIFEDSELDFSKNRAEGDDLLGDAYEYLMKNFAVESGKSKGQFYTPAEVSRIIAKAIGAKNAKDKTQTVYDPTCGSGSLLLKVAAETPRGIAIYGQEKENTTATLAILNMWLHSEPTADIRKGHSTLSTPLFTEHGALKTFDYVVANPPFSYKAWRNGFDPEHDLYGRFDGFGIPPKKNGDFAFLLHVLKSLKSTGKSAVILPHGVLFRGNAESDIRTNLIKRGYIKGIIGLPPNLFYGTGIPACIVVTDKEGANTRKGIFMIDASKGFMKDGPKNRLREQDIHQIVDIFTKQLEVPKYSRMVSFEEIKKNEFNLNIPRYIDSQEPEDIQDIEGHLKGGIPVADVEALSRYWSVCPKLRQTLFADLRPGYLRLAVDKAAIKPTIYEHPEFASFMAGMEAHFTEWRTRTAVTLKALKSGCHPKTIIAELGESLLAHYANKPLIGRYDVYQHLMDYWAAIMQDDCYIIAADGWKAETYRVIETKKGKDGKPGKEVDKGWTCDLVPKPLIVARYFTKEQAAITALEAELESLTAQMTELEEEHGGEEGLFSELDKVNKANVTARLKEIKGDKDAKDETDALNAWLKLNTQESARKKALKEAEADLDAKALAKYPKLNEAEVKTLVVEDKWLAVLAAAIHGEMDRISQAISQRVKELAERYETPLPQAVSKVAALEQTVNRHLEKMGFSWK